VIGESSDSSALSKLSSSEVSIQKDKSLIEEIGELRVKFCAVITFILAINREEEVTPATKIPIIKITIDNSIKENALSLLKL
jgi:hypothetical protein